MATTKTIWISKGRVSNVGGTITDDTGEDITAATFGIGLSVSRETPPDLADLVVPDFSTQGATTSDRKILLTIDEATATSLGFEAGDDVYCWGNITDNPEIEPVLFDRLIRLR